MKLFTFLLLLVLTSSFGYCQSKKESIKTLFTVLHLDSTTKTMYKNMSTSMIDQLSKSYSPLLGDSTIKKKYLAITKRYYETSLENSRAVIEQILPETYDKYFTEDEIKELTIFYRTKTGQKYILSQPEIIKEITSNPSISAKNQEMTTNLLQELQELFSQAN